MCVYVCVCIRIIKMIKIDKKSNSAETLYEEQNPRGQGPGMRLANGTCL